MSGFENLLKKFDSGNDYSSESELPSPSRAGSLEGFIQKFGHVSETYWFYNNTVELRFNVEEHRYYRVGELGNLIPLNGVTTVVGIIDKSHMLTPWAAKMMLQKLLRLMPTEMVDGVIRIKPLTFEEFTTIAQEAKTAHKDKLDEAGDIGHMAHKCLEDSINFAMQNDPQKIVRALINPPTDERAANAANGGLAWMLRHNVRWIETESKIYSREYDYAGTMDGMATCDSCDDKSCCPTGFKDRLSLIDWKSSNHLKIEYLFQTAAYKHAKQEEYPELKIEDTWILRLGKNDEEAGKFEPWHMTPDEYEEDFKGYLACLSLTCLVDSVEERMKGQKSTIRVVKKEQRESARALAKEQEKLQKALDKAAAKKKREEEKLVIKETARLKREETKAAKKAGIKPGSVRYKPNGETEWVVTQPGDNLYSVALYSAQETLSDTGWEPIEGKPEALPEGIKPHADEAFIGGAPCTSTSKEPATIAEKSTSLDSTCQTETSMKSPSTPPQTTQTPVPKQPSAHIISTAVTEQPEIIKYESETYTPKFTLPMEG